jgi:hypothetical protein
MKHRLIMAELLRCLQTIPGLRVQRDRREPESDEELLDAPLAILHSGERVTAELGNKTGLTWAKRWELRPVVTVLVAGLDEDAKREALEDIEAAFVDALRDSETLDALLVANTAPDFSTKHRNPEETHITGMEMFLNLTYDR